LVAEVSKRPIDGNLLSDQILRSVRQFAVGRPMKDDLTLVIADL
jgi:serine phosphatase RsbU (regulator of sigma subunit)